MDNSRRVKILAKLNCPSTPEPEKQVCRDLLEKYPKLEAYVQGKTLTFVSPSFEVGNVTINGQPVVVIRSKKRCDQCGNNFFVHTRKELYCPICLAALRKEAEG